MNTDELYLAFVAGWNAAHDSAQENGVTRSSDLPEAWSRFIGTVTTDTLFD